MAEKKKEAELFLGGGHLNIQSSQYVQTYNSLKLITIEDGAFELNVEIKADFSKIPSKYQEVFFYEHNIQLCIQTFHNEMEDYSLYICVFY